MNEITIKSLSPDLEKDYFDFFDNRAFSDGSPYYPCYCNAFNMSAGEIEAMRDQSKQYGDMSWFEGFKRSCWCHEQHFYIDERNKILDEIIAWQQYRILNNQR